MMEINEIVRLMIYEAIWHEVHVKDYDLKADSVKIEVSDTRSFSLTFPNGVKVDAKLDDGMYLDGTIASILETKEWDMESVHA